MVPLSLAFIEGLGGPEVMLILVIVLVLFGGDKLPDFARGMGKSIREFKKAAAGVEEELKRALEEDDRKKIMPPAPAPAVPAAPAPAASAPVTNPPVSPATPLTPPPPATAADSPPPPSVPPAAGTPAKPEPPPAEPDHPDYA
jgi:sec-independent protein translocase protein TatA